TTSSSALSVGIDFRSCVGIALAHVFVTSAWSRATFLCSQLRRTARVRQGGPRPRHKEQPKQHCQLPYRPRQAYALAPGPCIPVTQLSSLRPCSAGLCGCSRRIQTGPAGAVVTHLRVAICLRGPGSFRHPPGGWRSLETTQVNVEQVIPSYSLVRH